MYVADTVYDNGGYLSKIEYFDKFPLLGYTVAEDGANNSYYCDYSYNCGNSVLRVGGDWSSGLRAGLWRWYGDGGSSSSSSYVGGRLCYKPL